MTAQAQSNEKTSSRRSRTRRSSYFSGRRFSFFRSKGTRGADVETLRGNTGSSFEGYAKVERCGNYMNCCGIHLGAAKESRKPRLLLIKGSSLFIFTSEEDPSPKYAISLGRMHAEMEGHSKSTVLLKTGLGDVEYIFTFISNEGESIDKFLVAIKKAAADAQIEETKKRLGHDHVKRASCDYADQVAKEKIKDQPDIPVNFTEVMPVVPSTF